MDFEQYFRSKEGLMKPKQPLSHKFLLLYFVLLLALFCTACGKNDELEAYKNSVNTFYNEIATTSASINAIDPTVPQASATLLNYLDMMNVSFQNFAAAEVPQDYIAAESLADNAATYMDAAASQYRQAFTATPYDVTMGAAAKANYDNAMRCVEYIGTLLMGEIPEGEGVTVTYTNSENTAE